MSPIKPILKGDLRLIRGVGLRGAISINLISIIGIGPLITIPLVLGALHGPLSLCGWILGALLALCDGLVWAELGSLYPGSGGTYGYLREVFGRHTLGRLLAFLFVWQIIFVAPLNQAIGYLGFANYVGYLFPGLSFHPMAIKMIAIGIGILTILVLYRKITTVSNIGTCLAIISFGTLFCVTVAAFSHFNFHQVIYLPLEDSFWKGLGAGLGQALIISMYDYLGYNQSSCIGGEIIDPSRTIPRSILFSILIVAILYISMQIGVLGAIPWQSIIPLPDGSLPVLGQHIASTVVENSFGQTAASALTILVLIMAFGSVYGNLLGYSRIPFAGAEDGVFLPVFAHVHPKLRFPDVSLIVMGVLALPFCLFSIGDILNALTTGIVLIQSIAQIIALLLLHKRGITPPYRMWLFPAPALLALLGWIYVFISAGIWAIVFGIVSLLIGTIVYLVQAKIYHHWPFI